ncbi:MAG: NUDIX hydrolase [Hyphomicrobiales bacterium]|nr:NUDIX hydrolase [Hyphomicrobiales bacterium]MCP5371843.1 NUDIX hydrolase [Hyphomicrobiales bacterium]
MAPTLPGPSVKAVPEGDNRERLVCPDCGYIEYENPKIVVGAVCTWQGQFLLCKRAIEPRKGYWTFPAGFMESRETIAEGAAREVLEESLATVQMGELFGIYEIPRISQVYMIFRAELTEPVFGAGDETLESRLFHWDDIPWDDLAFPSIVWGLRKYPLDGGPWHHKVLPPK